MFKNPLVFHRYRGVREALKDLVEIMFAYCQQRQLPFMITDALSTLEEDKALNRQSATHREGRAVDLSINGWTQFQVEEFCNYFNKEFEAIAAIAPDGKPLLCYYKPHGTGPHIHVQIKRIMELVK